MKSPHIPRRIACLQPSATVILAAVGELGRVVACTRYCADVVPEVSDGSRIILADSWTADTSQIVAAHPDLVIAAVPYQEKAVSEILRAGARFLGLAPKNLEDIYTDIAIIAGAVGAPARGEKVIAAMQNGVSEFRARTTATPRPQSFLRGVGQAGDRFAALGRGTGRGRGRRVPGRAWPNCRRPEEVRAARPGNRRSRPGAEPEIACHWRRLSRNGAGSGFAAALGACFLHSRRIP